MSRRHRNMVTAGSTVTFFGKARGRQELLHREVRKLYDAGIVGLDKGKQCGARRQHCVHRIFQAPTFPKFRNWTCLEIKCEEFRQFVDAEWPGSHCDTLK